MPDLLTHYATSLLLTSRVSRVRYAVLTALIGLLPDVDSLLRIHRWFTHSLIITALVTAVAAVFITYVNSRLLKYVFLTSAIYTLHILPDMFTAPTPIAWPLTNKAYMISIELNGAIANGGLNISLNTALVNTTADFTPKQVVEGPIVTEQGIIVVIGVGATLILEKTFLRKGRA